MSVALTRWTRQQLEAEPGAAWSAAAEGGVLLIEAFWTPQQCAAAAQAVVDAEDRWIADFDGVQFAVGRAWYTHLETDRTAEYFRHAAEADATVDDVVPGLQQELRDAVSAAVGAPVVQRRGFCGAGVHVFPPAGRCAKRGGSVHFDYEGLTKAQLRSITPAISLVLMLQAPASGGGLKVWDVRFSGAIEPTPRDKAAPHIIVEYGLGDLVLFDSHRLHQIQPFTGDDHRISATLHGARGIGRWETWF